MAEHVKLIREAPTPDASMVEALEGLLADAKAGKVLSIVAVAAMRERFVGTLISYHPDASDEGSTLKMLGLVEIMKGRLIKRWESG